MTIDVAAANQHLAKAEALEIIRWAIGKAQGRAIVSTNFRPYEAVLLHMCTQIQPDIPVVWVDHGYNRPTTYRHAEALRDRLRLNLKIYIPEMTAARRDALMGGIPSLDDETVHNEFTRQVKLEPFARALGDLQPTVWLTALRREQTAYRASLDIVTRDGDGPIKVCPVLNWTEADMEAYLRAHDLPNEWDYYDPTKVDEKRECGLHPGFFTEQSAKR